MVYWILGVTVFIFVVIKTGVSSDFIFRREVRAQIESPISRYSDENQPVILSSPSRMSVLVGSTVIFPCRIDQDPGQHVIMWKRGRTRTLFVGTLRVEKDLQFSLNGTSLQIARVTPGYAGEYVCQLNTKPPTELIHILHVLVPPSVKVEPPGGHVIVKKGDPILVRCNAEGYPAPVVTWRFVDGYLPGRQKEKQGNILSIASAELHHTGIYQCSADNDVGEKVTTFIRVKVLYAPEVMVTPTWVHAGIGSTAEFKCVAIAEPSASLYWTHWTRVPDMVLQEDHHVTFEQHSNNSQAQLIMKIKRVTQEHFGSFACFANNSIGSAFRTVQISGLAEPVKFKSNSSGDEKESFPLMWTVKSYSTVIEYLLRIREIKTNDGSIPQRSWIDVMIPVDMQQSVFHSHSYNITGLQPGVTYEVVMQARNDFGWNHPSETFTFHTEDTNTQADGGGKNSELSLLPVIMTETSDQNTGNKHKKGTSTRNGEAQWSANLCCIITLLLMSLVVT